MGIQRVRNLKQLFRSEDAELHPIGEGNRNRRIKYNPDTDLKHDRTSQLLMKSLTLFFPEYRRSVQGTP